jgi:hypothetical protein
VELIDHYILDCTKENIEQNKTDSLYKETPKRFWWLNFCVILKKKFWRPENGSSNAGKKWASFSNSFGEDTNKVWTLRKAELGLLSNIPGDAKAVAVKKILP